MFEEHKRRRRNVLNYREERVTPRDVKPIGLQLEGDDKARYEQTKQQTTDAQPCRDSCEEVHTIRCMFPNCRSEFSNLLALSWHEYCSHSEWVPQGMTFDEYAEGIR